jgi:hypothetical protein
MTPIADMVRQMLAVGLPHEAIVLAVATAEKAAAAAALSTRHPVDAAAENRRAYDRQYKREKRAVHPTSSGIPPDEKAASLFEEKKEEQDRERKKEKRGTRCPADWEPSPANIQFTVDRGFSAVEIDTERIKFKLHSENKPGKDGLKLDWGKAWQTWILNDRNRKPRGATNGYHPGNKNDALAAIRRFREEHEDGPDCQAN